LHAIEYTDRSPYVSYYSAMRRLACAKWVRHPSGKVPFVVSTVSEYLQLRARYRCLYVACLGEIDPMVHEEQHFVTDGGDALNNVLIARDIYLFSRPFLFSNPAVFHGYVSQSFSFGTMQKRNIFWMSAMKENDGVAYPVLSSEYQSLITRPASALLGVDSCRVRFVRDGSEMRSDLYSFSVSEIGDGLDHRKTIVVYRGNRYEQPSFHDKNREYFAWISFFSHWTVGPSPAFCLALKEFLVADVVLDLPVSWDARSWASYVAECGQHYGHGWHDPRLFIDLNDEDVGDLRGRDDIEESDHDSSDLDGSLVEGEADGW